MTQIEDEIHLNIYFESCLRSENIIYEIEG
jgi:uncharacterized protein YfcZ (UPF0381/DUF406 family)